MHSQAYFPTLDRPERQSSADGMKGDEVGSMDENKSTLFQPNPENDIFLLMGDSAAGKKIRDITCWKGRSQIICSSTSLNQSQSAPQI